MLRDMCMQRNLLTSWLLPIPGLLIGRTRNLEHPIYGGSFAWRFAACQWVAPRAESDPEPYRQETRHTMYGFYLGKVQLSRLVVTG